MKILAKQVFSPAALIAVLLILTVVLIAQNPFLKDLGGLSRWIEPTGLAYSAPACGSSSSMVTCSGSNAVVDFTWADEGNTVGVTCQTVEILAKKSNQSNYTQVQTGLPCSGTYRWTGAEKNKTYNYEIRYKTASYQGECTSWDTWTDGFNISSSCASYATYTRAYPYSYNETTCGYDLNELYSCTPDPSKPVVENGHLINGGTFDTPNCNQGAPAISISVVGSHGETATVGSNQTVNFPIVMGDPEFTWSSSGADSCSWSPAGWTGLSGVRSNIIYNPVDYTLTCVNSAGSTFGTVHITAIPPSSSSSSSSGGGSSSSSGNGGSSSSSGGSSSSSSSGGGRTCPAGSTLDVLNYGTACSANLGTCWTGLNQCQADFQNGAPYDWPLYWVQCTDQDPVRLPGSTCSSSSSSSSGGAWVPSTQCKDGADNDGDGKIDFPNDPGCASFNDNSEVNTPNWREIIPPSSWNLFQKWL